MTSYSDYNIHGQAETITDANNTITTRTFDSEGRLKSISVGGLTTSYTYNKAGELLTVTRPGNRTISYSYDAARRISAITDAEGNSIQYTYDTEGRKTREQILDPEGVLKRFNTFEYDEAGRLVKVLFPDNAEQTADYDKTGNLVQTVNATGLQTNMEYNALHRLVSVLEGGNTTKYIYDNAGNLTQVTDARGNITTYQYDDFGHPLQRTSPETGITSYSYDKAGNLISVTDGLNRTTDFDYDALNRLTRQHFGSTDRVFSYDQGENGKGLLSAITDEFGERRFTYNGLGQLTSEKRTIAGTVYTTSYAYSSTTAELEAITYPGGHTVSYLRNTAGKMHAIALDNEVIISAISHLPFGPLKKATLGTVPLTRGYDQRYNLMTIQAGSLLYTYTRDAAGHVTSIENLPAPDVAAFSEEYSYNAANNQLTVKGTTTYSYDALGNMTNDGLHTFGYDELNRITEVSKNGQLIARYGYDSSNRRILKTAGDVTTHYHYDSNNRLIAETLADGTPLRDYIYLDGEPIAVNVHQNNAGLYYYINDHLGTPQQLIDSAGAIVWQAAYLPFGEAQMLTEKVVNNLRFPGQYFDSETGLHYNWNRYYDPGIGRYISADPIGLNGGMNLYAYVQNDPVNWIDPWGLEVTFLIFDRGWGDLVNVFDTTWCKYRQKTWKNGFQQCIDQFSQDLKKCMNSTCLEQCEERYNQKFRECIKQNNSENGVTYPNARCFWKNYSDYYRNDSNFNWAFKIIVSAS